MDGLIISETVDILGSFHSQHSLESREPFLINTNYCMCYFWADACSPCTFCCFPFSWARELAWCHITCIQTLLIPTHPQMFFFTAKLFKTSEELVPLCKQFWFWLIAGSLADQKAKGSWISSAGLVEKWYKCCNPVCRNSVDIQMHGKWLKLTSRKTQRDRSATRHTVDPCFF